MNKTHNVIGIIVITLLLAAYFVSVMEHCVGKLLASVIFIGLIFSYYAWYLIGVESQIKGGYNNAKRKNNT